MHAIEKKRTNYLWFEILFRYIHLHKNSSIFVERRNYFSAFSRKNSCCRMFEIQFSLWNSFNVSSLKWVHTCRFRVLKYFLYQMHIFYEVVELNEGYIFINSWKVHIDCQQLTYQKKFDLKLRRVIFTISHCVILMQNCDASFSLKENLT